MGEGQWAFSPYASKEQETKVAKFLPGTETRETSAQGLFACFFPRGLNSSNGNMCSASDPAMASHDLEIC